MLLRLFIPIQWAGRSFGSRSGSEYGLGLYPAGQVLQGETQEGFCLQALPACEGGKKKGNRQKGYRQRERERQETTKQSLREMAPPWQ